MAASSAKSSKKTSSAGKTTKKKTSASSKKQEEHSSGELGLGTILGVVEQLASSGGSGSSKKKPKAGDSPLASLLSSLTGGSSGGGSINYASIVEMLLPLLLSNAKHSESFKSNPSKTIKQLTGVDVGEQHLGPIVEAVLGKLNSK